MTKGYPHVHAKVLMVGPDLSLHGGIVSVVKGYLDAGLPEACDAFEYLGTGIGSSKLGKSVAFSRALIRYAMIMPSYDTLAPVAPINVSQLWLVWPTKQAST